GHQWGRPQARLQVGHPARGDIDRAARHEYDELLAAIASERPVPAQALAELHAEVAQGPVSRLVAELVVQALEIVDVDQGERQRSLAQLAFALEATELALEPAPVERPGQLVDEHLAAGVGEPGL